MSFYRRTRTQVKPAPVKSTVVIFDATTRRPRPTAFARGLYGRQPYTAADLAWVAQQNAVNDESDEALDREFDRRAMESAMLDRYCAGFCL